MRTLSLLGMAAASTTVLLATAVPASATDGEQEVGLHQSTPITADDPEFAIGEECTGIPEGSDGWHFVLPGNTTTFVELRVTFEPGGELVVTTFGPPSDKHAYVASEAGATLVEASATVEGEPVNFRLSHTCPASDEETPGEETPGEETPGEETPGEETPGEETPGEETPGEETPAEETPAPEEGVAGGTTPEGEDDLAETGSGTPVFAIAGGAAALLAVGGYLALRRRGSHSAG
ncbi:LPXTG cell wall anchor domain-containing protein [Streptomyces sp. 6N223]|uniref:LPXTG cell wall anchor domain-containing protein n=1 Tax=Streptomyces sp. 6N223 TaxID=3457412 RepID=UPI003FCF369F